MSTLLCEVYKYFNIPIEWYYAAGTITAITLLIWEVNRKIEPYFFNKTDDSKNKIKTLCSFFVVSGVATIIVCCSIVFFVSMVLHNNTIEKTFVPLKLNLIYALLVNLLFHLVNAVFFYFKEYRSKMLEAEQLKSKTAIAELQLVKSQINPHFLFNNLNVLSSLVMQNNADANKFIEAFSQVYRYILNNQYKELVTVKDELEFIKPYIYLLEKRFTNGLKFTIDIAPEHTNKFIVPASLQMVIENAIKHNIATRLKPLQIQLQTNINEELIVTNNLQLREVVENSTSIGLHNIVKRYELFGKKEVVVQKTSNHFIVTLPLLNVH
ncbi:sensor histidine kinase [Ferruginibacter yonginensis]|uniref:Sensor histidine kinase n=1 Tax=Ferruginibacter yonginensis TaxID=1310416 RepID=A0ABV8QU17_9BACT